MYASCTHFRVKAWWALPLFYLHALRSGRQAHRTKGLVKMETWRRGVRDYFTLTVWMRKEDMLRFRTTGAHRIAMKISASIGQGYAVGWECTAVPHRNTAAERLAGLLKNKIFRYG